MNVFSDNSAFLKPTDDIKENSAFLKHTDVIIDNSAFLKLPDCYYRQFRNFIVKSMLLWTILHF